MAKAKIKIVTTGKSFTQEQLDSIRRHLNSLKIPELNFSVSIEIEETRHIDINEYIPRESRLLYPRLKQVKRNTKKEAS